MKARNILGWTLAAMLLLFLTGSGLAAGPGVTLDQQSTARSAATDVSVSSVTNAPWFKAEVDTDGDTGQYTSAAYDPFKAAVYVSYYDATSKSLRIARDDRVFGNCGPGDEWFCKTLDITAADVGKYSSIAVRPAGSGMGIAYHDATNGHLKFLWFDNPHLWTHHIATIDKGITGFSTTGRYTSIKYSSGDTPFIAYHFDNPGNVDALMLAYPKPDDEGNCGYGYWEEDWQCDTIKTGEGIGQYASLALDTMGRPHIAYYDRGNGDLWYATSAVGSNCGPGNSWTCYAVSGTSADVGKYASMYVDGGNHFHIAYYDDTADTLMYATNARTGNCGVLGSAQCDPIDDMQEDYHPVGVSIAEDAAGYPVIAYQDGDGSLKLARPLSALGLLPGDGDCGPQTPFSTWSCETIDRYGRRPPYRNGDFASIALSPSGLATIAYNGFIVASGGNLEVARQRIQVFLPMTMRELLP